MKTLYENRQWWLDDERMPSRHVPEGTYRETSQFPFVTRDVTVPFDTAGSFVADAVSRGGKYLERLHHLGDYEGNGKHASSFRLVFQDLQRTLTNEEIDETMKEIYQ